MGYSKEDEARRFHLDGDALSRLMIDKACKAAKRKACTLSRALQEVHADKSRGRLNVPGKPRGALVLSRRLSLILLGWARGRLEPGGTPYPTSNVLPDGVEGTIVAIVSTV